MSADETTGNLTVLEQHADLWTEFQKLKLTDLKIIAQGLAVAVPSDVSLLNMRECFAELLDQSQRQACFSAFVHQIRSRVVQPANTVTVGETLPETPLTPDVSAETPPQESTQDSQRAIYHEVGIVKTLQCHGCWCIIDVYDVRNTRSIDEETGAVTYHCPANGCEFDDLSMTIRTLLSKSLD